MILTDGERQYTAAGIRMSPEGDFLALVDVPTDRDLILISNHLDLQGFNYDISRYSVFLFSHADWPEASVLEVHDGKKRVGVLFALQALSSPQTILIEDPHHNAFGAIALERICLGQYEYGPDRWEIQTGGNATLSDLIGEDVVVLLLDHVSCQHVYGAVDLKATIAQRLYSLAKYGIYPMRPEANAGARFSAEALEWDPYRKQITLRPLSSDLPPQAAAFLEGTFLATAPRERHPVFRFFVNYQALELLMEDVFSRLTKDFAARITASTSPSQYKDYFREFQKASEEGQRLSRVFNANRGSFTNDSFDALKFAIDDLLVKLNEEAAPNLEKSIYAMRNLLFHRFAKVQGLETELDLVARRLLICICDLVVYYRIPIGTL